MRILLTGSSGWLGRFLVPRLRAEGHHVTGLDVAPGADTDLLGSVADRALIDRIFADRAIEAVIHAGALHKPDIARYPARPSSRSTSPALSTCWRRPRRQATTGSCSLRPLP